jgi:microcystin-dependent protein
MNNLKLNNIIYIIIIILLIIIIYYLYNKNENFDNAFDTIVNKYYDTNGMITMNNLNVTGNLNFGALKGVIVAWSGLVTNIPSGWGLCDGTTYKALDSSQLQSPDLRGKFILGASKPITTNNYIVDDVQTKNQPNIPGTNPIQLTPQQPYATGGAETHTLTLDELPSHTHVVSEVLSWHKGVHGPISSGNSGHSSASTTGTTGGGQSHNNMPPYYSLIYIIKL